MYKEKKNYVQSSKTTRIGKASEDWQTKDHSQSQVINRNAFNGHRAEMAVRILIEKIAKIRYVKQWAEKANVSVSWLKKEMNTTYDKPPKIILREVRFEVITYLIMEKGMEASSLCVAIESGVGKTSDALYKFLNRHYDTTFTKLKEKVLTDKRETDFSWLEWKDRFYFYKYRNGRQKYRNRR